jgi:hypothetical protein
MNREIPEVLDWVKERAACTPLAIFETLRKQVKSDMEARNSLSAENGFIKRNFNFHDGDGSWFGVGLPRRHSDSKGVTFHLTPVGVTVRDIETRNVIYEAALTLSNEGKCRLKVHNDEYNLWQFRKMALHWLFFEDQEIV